jgi:hypothetical protein
VRATTKLMMASAMLITALLLCAPVVRAQTVPPSVTQTV